MGDWGKGKGISDIGGVWVSELGWLSSVSELVRWGVIFLSPCFLGELGEKRDGGGEFVDLFVQDLLGLWCSLWGWEGRSWDPGCPFFEVVLDVFLV